MFRRILKRYNKTVIFNRRKKTSDVTIYIDGKQVQVPSYFTVLQACRKFGYTVPTFCYHDRLAIAGNCRMCLVQLEGAPKPQIACALPVAKNMKILTKSPVTLKAQEAVLEFLLVNHPLDCPICDQGGECDLQDLCVRFGNDKSRYTDINIKGKRAVENCNLGPLISTEMTRCIHCTRCIRFGAQVCGLDVLGTSGRGSDMLVGTYVDKMFLSELSGNIIDLCPVGALTSGPYAFKARPWELKRTNSIDVTDATGTNIVINSSSDRVLRVLPREHNEINQEWLSDKGRWAIDSLEIQRFVTPMQKINGRFTPIEWNHALKITSNCLCSICPEKIMAIAGPHCNVETLVVAKDLLNVLGVENTFIERDLCYSYSGIDIRAAYSLNINMQDIAKADKILLVGTNPRFEAPILNIWIREAYIYNEADIYYIGEPCSFNYFVNYLGADITRIGTLLQDGSFMSAKNPLILVGVSQLALPQAGMIMSILHNIAKSFVSQPQSIPLHIIPREASWAGALECGWKPGGNRALKETCPCVVFLLGADQVVCDWIPSDKCVVIYVGFQGTIGAEMSNIILPGSAFTEAGGLYLNMECRSQYAYPAVTPPGKARFDWKIFRALAEYCGVCLFYDDNESLNYRMAQISPNFNCLGYFQEKMFFDLIGHLIYTAGGENVNLNVDMKTLIDYYCSDIFSYNSPTMIRARNAACKMSTSPYARI